MERYNIRNRFIIYLFMIGIFLMPGIICAKDYKDFTPEEVKEHIAKSLALGQVGFKLLREGNKRDAKTAFAAAAIALERLIPLENATSEIMSDLRKAAAGFRQNAEHLNNQGY